MKSGAFKHSQIIGIINNTLKQIIKFIHFSKATKTRIAIPSKTIIKDKTKYNLFFSI
jgi:phage-related tail protein